MWVSPPAEIIETALDDLKSSDTEMRESQQSELHSATGKTSTDFARGYELGLQTARMMIARNVKIQANGIDPKTIL